MTRMQWVLPEVVHPPDTVCYIVHVPKERFYIAAFLGTMYNLCKPFLWADDPAHTALEVGKVWTDIFDSLLKGECDIPPTTGLGGEGSDCMGCCLRFNNGVLQQLECGVWVDVAGQGQGGGGGIPQPGGGSPQPPAGGCVDYHVFIEATQLLLVPTLVSTGDTITITDAVGAATDGGALWYCPEGSIFAAGICLGGTEGTNGSDPVPAANHMSIIATINGTSYGFTSGVFTVPSGITNQQVTLQVNDSNLSDNSGSYDVFINVCNNQPAPGSVAITYAVGSGPASVLPGDTITMNSNHGGTPQVDFTLSREMKVTYLASNIAVTCSGTCGFSQVEDPLGTVVQSLTHPPNNSPVEYGTLNTVRFQCASGGGGPDFFVTMRFDNP